MRVSMVCALILTTLASSGSTKTEAPHINPIPSQDVKNPILKDLHLVVRTDKDRFDRGEPIVIEVSVKNDAATVVYLPNT